MSKNLARIRKLEGFVARARISYGSCDFSANCICFPCDPKFLTIAEEDSALAIKCSVHGDRFRRGMFAGIFCPGWKRCAHLAFEWVPQALLSQFLKAWWASFPLGYLPIGADNRAISIEDVNGDLELRKSHARFKAVVDCWKYRGADLARALVIAMLRNEPLIFEGKPLYDPHPTISVLTNSTPASSPPKLEAINC